MGPEFWKPDKPSKLKKCSEFISPACNPVPTDGCCAVIPCSYCLTWDPYTGSTLYGTAEWTGTGWSGTVGGAAFVGYWEVGYASGECEFVVTLNGDEVYRVDCYGGQSCRDSSDSVDAEIGGITGTLTWQKILHRPLEYVADPESYCVTHFCGECECACNMLCATLIGADCCELRFVMSDVSYPCDGPEWYGSGMCGDTLYEATVRLTRRDYDGACIIGGDVNGEALDETELSACIGWTMTWTLYDGTSLRVVCDVCDCDVTGDNCTGGCCWPRLVNDLYPCGVNIPVPFEISAPGCDLDGTSGEFTPVSVDAQGTCGSCGAAPPVNIGPTLGVLKVPVPGFGYCNDTPCGIEIYMVLECDDTSSAGALDACCGKFRLWIGTDERMVGWDGTAPLGGSASLYWIKFAPSSCSCDPLAAVFDVSLVLDCPTTFTDGPCVGEPTCCDPICSSFTLTI
jgi:hypothetical protein